MPSNKVHKMPMKWDDIGLEMLHEMFIMKNKNKNRFQQAGCRYSLDYF